MTGFYKDLERGRANQILLLDGPTTPSIAPNFTDSSFGCFMQTNAWLKLFLQLEKRRNNVIAVTCTELEFYWAVFANLNF